MGCIPSKYYSHEGSKNDMIKVEYGAIESGAKKEFNPELLNCSAISKAEDLKQEDLEFKNFCNPCEKYSVLLDGSRLPIPDDISVENIGVWSEYASNNLGVFETAIPLVRLTSSEPFSTEGLTLKFDTRNNVYPTEISVSWYNGNELIKSEDYSINSPVFSVYENVDNFDKIEISFNKMNTPYSRLKLHSIEYGTLLIIEGKNIKSMKISQKISPISSTIPISTADMSFKNNINTDYNFSARQSLKIYNNDVLIGKYFIENAKQTTKQQWSINAKDYIALLESADFEGGIYVNEFAENILTAIFNKADVPFVISEALKQQTVSGYIPYTTCRDALQQVIFAIGGYVRTAYSDVVEVLESDLNVVESIGLSRILTGQTVSISADITQFELFAHSYTPIDDEIILYQSENPADEVRVIFNEPVQIDSLTIENGEILERGTNYAVISCTSNANLKGKKYKHTTISKSITNTKAYSKKSSNNKAVKNATLVSPQNIDKILNICYNYIVRNVTANSRVIEGTTPLVVGNAYEIETEILGKISGVLVEQSFSLYGGKKVTKETVIQ